MRDSTEPYCFIMLLPRESRGGTMRPENSSKLWLKTFCERPRESTAWSSVTPLRPDAIADWEIPFAAASALNSSSQAGKLPVPQGTAETGVVEIASIVLTAKKQREITGCRTESFRSSGLDGEICLRQPRPKQGFYQGGPSREASIGGSGYRSTRKPRRDRLDLTCRPYAAMETG